MLEKTFEIVNSKQLLKVETENTKKTNNPDQGVRVYGNLLDKKVKSIENWMDEVAEKASIKHEELKSACEKAKNIKEDVTRYLEDGKKIASYSEEIWKKKTTPFAKLKILAEQIDSAITHGTVEEFKKLENLLK